MYANKVTIAVSPMECSIKFSCTGPFFDDEGKVVGTGDLESCKVVMQKEMLQKLRDLITEVLDNDKNGSAD